MLWLQVNGMNVARASHEYAVQLIRETGSQLVLRVLTVASPSSGRPSTMDSRVDGKEARCGCFSVVVTMYLCW